MSAPTTTTESSRSLWPFQASGRTARRIARFRKAMADGKKGSTFRVLLVSEPGRDGVFRHVEVICRSLVAAGVEVDYAYSSARSSEANEALVRWIEQHGGRTIDLKIGSSPCLGDFVALLKLAAFTASRRYDLIHAHSSKAGGLVRLLSSVFQRVPVLYTPNAYFGMVEDSPRAVFFRGLEALLGHASITINVSQSEREFAIRRLRIPASRLHVIHNGVDLSRFSPPSDEQKRLARAQLQVPPNARVVCVVARDSFQKNLGFLYEGIALARRSEPSLVLLHVGEGEMEPHIERLGLQGAVIRVRYLADTAVAYRAADVFSLTSRYEGLSIAVIEALACGLPVALSDVSGNSEFFSLGLPAVHPFSIDSMAGYVEALHRALATPRSTVVLQAERARLLFDQHRMVEKLLSVYRGVAINAPDPELPRPKRVTVISNLFAPDELGGAALMTDLAEYLHASGYQLNVVTTFSYYPRWELAPADRDCLVRDEIMPSGLPVRRVWMYVPKAASTVNRLLSDVSFFFSIMLLGRTKARHADVLVSACPMFGQMLATRILSGDTDARKFAIVQDFVVDAALDLQMIRVPFIGPYLKALERWVFSGFHTLTTISDEMHDKLNGLITRPVRTLFVPNWIHGDLEQAIERGKGRQTVRRERQLFYSGNVGRKQGLHHFLASFDGQRTGWTIQINGGGAELDAMVEACRGRPEIVYGDVQPVDAYIDSLLTCTACLITQLSGVGANFLPSKILPALASGTPILAVCEADTPLGREVLASGCGEVVAPEDPDALCEVLQRWAAEPELLQQYGQKALARAELYSRERILGEFREEIDALCVAATQARKWV